MQYETWHAKDLQGWKRRPGSKQAAVDRDTFFNTFSSGGGALRTPVESVTAGPPPGIIDLSTVEWSYLDPQGQVQGTSFLTTLLKSLPSFFMSQAPSLLLLCRNGTMMDTSRPTS